MNRILIVVLALMPALHIIVEVRRKKFPVRESFWWLMLSLFVILIGCSPYFIDSVAELFGVAYPPSLFFVCCLIFLLVRNFTVSKRVWELQKKLLDLAQNVSALESEAEEREEGEK